MTITLSQKKKKTGLSLLIPEWKGFVVTDKEALDWRTLQLLRAGCSTENADGLAKRQDVDYRVFVRMVEDDGMDANSLAESL